MSEKENSPYLLVTSPFFSSSIKRVAPGSGSSSVLSMTTPAIRPPPVWADTKVSEKDAFFFCYAARLLSIFIFKTSLVFSIISFGKVILQK